jgi:hypothetical protein
LNDKEIKKMERKNELEERWNNKVTPVVVKE